MNETQLCTIEQIEQFLIGCSRIEFSKSGDDSERYEHISRALKRFDYPKQGKREKGVLLKCSYIPDLPDRTTSLATLA